MGGWVVGCNRTPGRAGRLRGGDGGRPLSAGSCSEAAADAVCPQRPAEARGAWAAGVCAGRAARSLGIPFRYPYGTSEMPRGPRQPRPPARPPARRCLLRSRARSTAGWTSPTPRSALWATARRARSWTPRWGLGCYLWVSSGVSLWAQQGGQGVESSGGWLAGCVGGCIFKESGSRYRSKMATPC